MNFVKRPLFRLFAAVLAVCLFSVSAFALCSEHRMDSGTVTLEPSCTLIGVITYTCRNEGCDYSYTEKLGNLGHRYENGVCLNCGDCEEGFLPAEPAESEPVVLKNTAVNTPAADPEPAPITIAPRETMQPVVLAAPAAEPPAFSDPVTLAVLILTLACGTGAILLNRRLIRN